MDGVLTYAGWITATGAALLMLYKIVGLLWGWSTRVRDALAELRPGTDKHNPSLYDVVYSALYTNGDIPVKDAVRLVELRLSELEKDRLLDKEERFLRQAETDSWRQWVMYQLVSRNGLPENIPFKMWERSKDS